MALTDEAITKIRALIQSGELAPGSRLPPEQQLAAQLGLSRNSMREAVKALVLARVLDVRRGDGTYVTSLAPQLLLQGLGFAVDLLQDDTLAEVMEVRRMLEPVATGLAATRMTGARLADVEHHLEAMRDAGNDIERLVHSDIAFHREVVRATGNDTLVSVLDGLSSRTLRARVWRGLVEGNAAAGTLSEHETIVRALRAGDGRLAEAAALLHVTASEAWLRATLEQRDRPGPPDPDDQRDDHAGIGRPPVPVGSDDHPTGGNRS
ncbi:MAG TPA: FadR/GntR family transcriptional regulator [Mycobacteriales bacterium]|nr:FadR/GntR family transcriptional regulator [Mycobacteriales bacterium]